MRAGERNVFRREGEYWTIVFDGRTVRVRDRKGLRYLATLLRRPGERIHATQLRTAADHDLAGPGVKGRTARRPTREQARVAVTKNTKGALERIAAVHPALGAHLRATVRCGYLCRYVPDPRHPITWED